MSGFFDKLFGRKQARPPAERNEPTPITNSESFQPYKTGEIIGGKFEVCRAIGRGDFGIVYQVRSLETGEDFAIKTFKGDLGADAASADAFKREALVWVKLQRHPHILPAVWVDGVRYGSAFRITDDQKLLPEPDRMELAGRLFVAMELVKPDDQGRVNLEDHLQTGGVDREQMLIWGIQFCCGMEHARAHGIECHRDIKPANIMITREGTVRVSDFGLAVATESALRSARRGMLIPQIGDRLNLNFVGIGDRAFCGTPGYIPPEIYRAETATVQSDIYSFGIVLWQMINGSPHLPFRTSWNGNIRDYLSSIYDQQVSGQIPLTNDAIGNVVARCLRPRAGERFNTFSDVRTALEPIYESLTRRKYVPAVIGGQSVASLNNRGASLAALHHYEEAIRCYDGALAIDPLSYKTWNNKGNALSALGRSDEALNCFNRCLSIDPGFSMAERNINREMILRAMKALGN